MFLRIVSIPPELDRRLRIDLQGAIIRGEIPQRKRNRVVCIAGGILIFSILAASPHPVQTPGSQKTIKSETVSPETKSTLIQKICDLLIQRYVHQEPAEAMRDLLNRKLKNGDYDLLGNAVEFARILTVDMQSVCRDKHLKVVYDPVLAERTRATRGQSNNERKKTRRAGDEQARRDNFGFRRIEIMSGNIDYLELTGFSGLDEAQHPGRICSR